MQLVSSFSSFKFGDKGLNITKENTKKKSLFLIYSIFI